ncbi:MAG: hypothetical protein M3N37_03905 [Actinomycetota bacterium]|nr:hypothetical protein [Actinomycetota bacterium]
MTPRYPSLLQPPVAFFRYLGVGHPDEDPLAPVAAALADGVTGVACDVHLTADGDPVIHAQPTLRTGWRRRPLAALASSQVPDGVPRLAELYERCGTGFDLAVHLVDDAAVARVVAVTGEAGGQAGARLWLCSPDWRQAASWRAAAGESRLVDATRLRHVDEGPERRAAVLAGAGIDAVRLHESDWNAGLCALFHRFGRLALAGPASHRRQLDALVRMGVDGLTSEHPDRLAQALAERSGPGRGPVGGA